MKNILAIFYVTAVFIFGQSLAHANLLNNGSFEQANISNGSDWASLSAGDDTSLPGWTVVDAGLEWVKAGIPLSGNSGPAAEGAYMVDLNNYRSTDGGGVQQSFDTVVGSTYLVEFYGSTMKSNDRDGTGVIEVFIGDEHYTYNIKTDSPTLEWTYFSFSYKATENVTTLKFSTSTNSFRHFAFIDGVSVKEMQFR